MSLLAQLLIRVMGPAVVLIISGLMLAPAMNQPSRMYVNVDVAQLVGQQLWPTLGLLATAIAIATAIWLPLAMHTARNDYRIGLTVTPVGVLAQAMAPFWIAIVGLLLFGNPAGPLVVSGVLAIVVLGFLAHATYLRGIASQAMRAESDADDLGPGDPWLELAEDWLDTIGRQAGMLVGALMLIEQVFKVPGLGRFFVDGLRNADATVRSTALFDLIALSATLTVVFGIGAELVRWQRERQQAMAPDRQAATIVADPSASAVPEPRWLALLTVALGGLIAVVLMVLATSTTGQPMAVHPDAVGLPAGSPGHAFGTDPLGRDMHARIAAGVRTGFQVVLAHAFFTVLCGVPLGLLAARLGRVVDGITSVLIDGILIVPPLVLVVGNGIVANGPNYQHMLVIAMVMVFARLTRDAVRAVWPGERRDGMAAAGAVLMSLLLGMSAALLLEAMVSFLGVRMPPFGMSLGELLATGHLAATRAPWLAVYPGIVLTALAASLILLGYGTLGLFRSRPASAQARPQPARRLAEA